MSARFPAEVRTKAVDLFLAGMPYTQVCDHVEAAYGQRPAESTVVVWVKARHRGRNIDPHQPMHAPETVARAVALRVCSSDSFVDVGDQVGVSAGAVRAWTMKYFPDEDERVQAASLPLDQVYAITMKRVSKHRKLKRTRQSHTQQPSGKQQADVVKVAPVQQWLPAVADLKDGDSMTDDPEKLKVAVQALSAYVEVLLGEVHQQDRGDGLGKGEVREDGPSTAAKAAVVVFLTEHASMSIAKACAVVGLAQSTFYHHQGPHQHVVKKRHARRTELKQLILQAVEESGQSYGYRRIHAWLERAGYRVSEKIVREIMDTLGCHPPAKVSTKYSSYAGESAHKPKNLMLISGRADDEVTGVWPKAQQSQYFRTHAETKQLTHDFHADSPWQKIGTDVTEIRCTDGKLYLSAAIDFYDGMPVSVTMSRSPNHDLVKEMMDTITTLKPNNARPIIHSDRGGLYRSPRWVELISAPNHDTETCPTCNNDQWCEKRWAYIPSLSRKGNCGDNARTEGFFGTFKQERLKGRHAPKHMTVDQMRDYIENYLDFFINRRLKSTLGDGYTTIAEHRQALSA